MMKKLIAVLICLLFACSASFGLADINSVTLPLVERLAGAQKADTFFSDDETRAVTIYTSADEDALDEFLMMCPMCGVYPMDMGNAIEEDSPLEGYFLIHPGTAFDGYVLLDPVNGDLSVDFGLISENIYLLNEESAQTLRYMYDYDMKLPSGGGNVAPQFYAVINRQPDFQGQSSAGFAFDDAVCWTEWYTEVDEREMGEYATIMGLFGFYAMVDLVDFDEEGRINPVLLRFSNGDADILVLYDAIEQTASVYYQPGVTYNLLSGGDLNEILPQ